MRQHQSNLYWRCWFGVRDLLRVANLLRLNLLVLFLVAVALCVPAQSRDAFRTLGENILSQPTGTALTIAAVFSISLWYTSTSLIAKRNHHTGPTGFRQWVCRRSPVLLAALPFLILCMAFYLARTELSESASSLRKRLLTMATLSAGIGIFWTLAIIGINQTFESKKRTEAADLRSWVMTVCGIVSITTLLIATVTPIYATWIGPIATILLCATSWIYILHFVILFLRRFQMPLISVLTVLGLAFGAGDRTDNHEVRTLGKSPLKPLPRAADALRDWLNTRPDYERGKKYPVFIVAAEGGGIRAAYWSCSILTDLDGSIPNFRRHVFAISGVSGGSVGAAVYAGLVCDDERGGINAGKPTLPRAQAILSQDLLSPALAMGGVPDLAQQFLFFPIAPFDRARGLEYAIEEAWENVEYNSRMKLGFYALRPTGAKTNVPFLILNTTEVESGERVPVSHFLPDTFLPGSMKVFADVQNTEIRLSTAACLSARFPVVTPAGTVSLGDGRKLRFADGGYFENSGTATTLDMLQDLLRAADEEPATRNVDLRDAVFVVIRPTYVGGAELDSARSSHGFGDPASPIRALLATREARGKMSADHLDRFLSDASMINDRVFPFSIVFECKDADATVPLGWTLSNTARNVMHTQLPSSGPSTSTNARERQLLIDELNR